ncbi:hypothetical protein [Streptomyces sp. NPDC015125]|uniref:hypothetical protein n=1 Tax=Streptomyces sp. NPDC015125 TaxID=3364938 RepID=UPI0036F86E05
MIAEPFEPLDERPQDILTRLRQARLVERAGQPLPAPAQVALRNAAIAEKIWMLRRWDRHDDVVTPHFTEESALADLAAYVDLAWNNAAGMDGGSSAPPTDAREAVLLYYGPDRDLMEDEGYELYETEIAGRDGTVFAPQDSPARPSLISDACQRCGGTGFLALATEWANAPALCTDCHEALDTQQARDGHQCLDGCPRPADHTGLCIP